ncbi:MAG: tRNA-binding protein [Candidatus Puniceispirillaceae bacterium]
MEDKETFECHPSVDSVLNKVEEIVDIKSGNKLPENWLESFENVVTQEVSQYEDFFPVEDGDIVVDLGASTGVWSIPMSDKAKVVYAVEPFPNMINIIKPRIENIDNIILDTIPIGDGSETTKIFGGVVDETMVVKSQTFMDFVKKHNIEKIDFLKVDIRVGRIIEVEAFPEARKPAWKLKIDFGSDIGVKKSSAQITDLYDAESLLGRQILAVVNFPPRQIGPFMSEVLTLGVSDAAGAIVLIKPDNEVKEGARLH